MKVLIIEDEPISAVGLRKQLENLRPEIKIEATIDSIEDAVEWLSVNDAPDLIFMDIQLGDGSSFDIFNQVEVKSPVIFITASDEYALKAFKVNSIDYLIKPVAKNDLEAALEKFEQLEKKGKAKTQTNQVISMEALLES